MVLRFSCSVIVIGALFCATFLAPGEPIYVDRSVPSSGDGASWETAFKTIREGIEAAEDGDEVIVAEGTYIESVDFKGKDITVRSTNPSDAMVVGSTVILASGSPEAVRFRSSEGRNAMIAGFTITAGQVGVSCVWSSPVIRNNVIEGNHADYDKGGGVSCYYSSALIENNIIASNFAAAGGGGIACEGAKPLIVGNLILGNVTDMEGGGILCVDCAPRIVRNRIIGNDCLGNGGGVSCHSSQLELINNLIVSNTADSMGGGLVCYNSVARIAGNTIANNSAQGDGGGGIEFLNSSGDIVNCILWGNGDDLSGCKATFSCIEDDDEEDQGEGNIHNDPAFLDPDGEDNVPGTEDDDYALPVSSPCVDKGSFSAAATLSLEKEMEALRFSWDPGADVLGNSRISGRMPDMGCHEYQSDAATYVIESSYDLRVWSVTHTGPDTYFSLAPMPAADGAFFRLSLSRE